MALPALGGAHAGRERLQLLEGVYAESTESFHEAMKHVDRRPGVGESPVVGCGRGVEQPGQRRELAVGGVVTGDHAAGQLCGVEHLELRPRPLLAGGEVLEEADVERRIVGNEHAPLRELEERG